MVVVSGINNAGDSRERGGEEEADFEFDSRLARRWKRRRVAYESFRFNSCSNNTPKKTILQSNKNNDAFVEAMTVESDYGKFLNDVEEFVDFDIGVDTDARCVNYATADADSNDNVGDIFDPHYMKFLDNLKEDGKSYVLELALGETSVVVKYEKEDDVNNELDVENLETTNCHLRKWKLETRNVLKGHSEKERIESPRRVLRSNSSRQNTESPRMNCRSNAEAERTKSPEKVLFSNSWNRTIGNPRTTLRCKSKRKIDENPGIMHDVVKREKIEIPRTLRSNSRREDNENSSILHDLSKIEKAESARALRVLRRESMGTQKNLRAPMVEKNVQKEVEDPVSSSKNLRESLGTQKNLREPTVENNVEKEAEDPISSAKNGCPSKRHSREITNSAEHQCNHGVNYELVDESYLEFLKILKNGQHLECTPEGGKKVVYEDSDSDSEVEKEKEAEDPVSSAENVCSSKRQRPEATNSAEHQCNPGVKSDLVDESYGEFLKLLKDGQHLECTVGDGKKVIYEVTDSDSEVEKIAQDLFEKNGCSSKRHNPEVTNSPKRQCRVKSDLVDESYQEILKLLKDGQHLECTSDGGIKVIYEESDSDSEVTILECTPAVKSDLADESYLEFLKLLTDSQHLEYTPDGGKKVIYEESDSDSDIIILDDSPFSDGKHIPFVDLDGEECIENPGSQFRKELMEILRKPFDRLEYKKLWEEASRRRPMEGLRILRSQMISYQLDSNSKSYLEHDGYSDLATEIDQACGDKCRILNLLRGFFYWLQNLAHKGAFKPWLDSSCLSILPPVELGDFTDQKAKSAV